VRCRLAIVTAKLEAGTNAKSQPEVTGVTVNLPYCPLSPPLKCLKIGKPDLPISKGDVITGGMKTI
jgi:hypothetical protein